MGEENAPFHPESTHSNLLSAPGVPKGGLGGLNLPLPPQAHNISGISKVEEQAAVLVLVAEVGVLGQVEEGLLNALCNTLDLFFLQRQVGEPLSTAGTSKPSARNLCIHLV